jgi:hypothetical protein
MKTKRFALSLGLCFCILAGFALPPSAASARSEGGVRTRPAGRASRLGRTTRARWQAPTPAPGQAATLLPDGRFLLTGGTEEGAPQSAVRIYDPSTGQTLTMPWSLQVARAYHTATMLPDGQVLVFGGVGAGGRILASAEVVNTEAGTTRAPRSAGLASARAYHTATLLTDGGVLLVGGVSEGARPVERVELWDSKTETARPTCRSTRASHSASQGRCARRL